MKNQVKLIALILLAFALLLPLTSQSPDAVENLSNLVGGVNHAPTWEGLMSGYSVAFVSNSYFSTLTAGVFGTLMVLVVALGLGKAISPKKRT